MRLIYLSPVPWCSFSQRPHELVRYFHSYTGGEVLWVDPYPGRFPTLSDVFNGRPKSGGMNCDVPPWVSVFTPRALPIEPLPFSSFINRLFWRDVNSAIRCFTDNSTILGIGKPTTLASHLLSKYHFSSSFYDAMDNYPAFYKGWSRIAMASRERGVIANASTILTSSSTLLKRLQLLAPDVRLVLNACAADRLPKLSRVRQLDHDQIPVIGYVGTIGQWFDWNLVITLAKTHPSLEFRLIGPIYLRPPPLPHNIVLESPLSHPEALLAMTQFNVGLIPFKKTMLTSCVDPIKYYEYRALGLPVLSTAFGEMALRGEDDGVYLIKQGSDMTEVIGQALVSCTDSENTIKFREKNSWKSRFDQAGVFESLYAELERINAPTLPGTS